MSASAARSPLSCPAEGLLAMEKVAQGPSQETHGSHTLQTASHSQREKTFNFGAHLEEGKESAPGCTFKQLTKLSPMAGNLRRFPLTSSPSSQPNCLTCTCSGSNSLPPGCTGSTAQGWKHLTPTAPTEQGWLGAIFATHFTQCSEQPRALYTYSIRGYSASTQKPPCNSQPKCIHNFIPTQNTSPRGTSYLRMTQFSCRALRCRDTARLCSTRHILPVES